MKISVHVLNLLPGFVREHLLKRRELVKFLLVGGFCWFLTAIINFALKQTIFQAKPVIALTIATVLTTLISYAINRDWTFKTRGGRQRHHEMFLYVVINAIGIGLNSGPLFLARNVFALRSPHLGATMEEISDFFWGMIIGTLVAMVFRMWAYRRWVFPHEKEQLRVPARAGAAAGE